MFVGPKRPSLDLSDVPSHVIVDGRRVSSENAAREAILSGPQRAERLAELVGTDNAAKLEPLLNVRWQEAIARDAARRCREG